MSKLQVEFDWKVVRKVWYFSLFFYQGFERPRRRGTRINIESASGSAQTSDFTQTTMENNLPSVKVCMTLRTTREAEDTRRTINAQASDSPESTSPIFLLKTWHETKMNKKGLSVVFESNASTQKKQGTKIRNSDSLSAIGLFYEMKIFSLNLWSSGREEIDSIIGVTRAACLNASW